MSYKNDRKQEDSTISTPEKSTDVPDYERITMEDIDFDTQLNEENSTINSRYS